MSRRKQAKPRSLKREDVQCVDEEESSQDTLALSDTKEEDSEDHFETGSAGVSDDHHSLDEEEEEEDISPNACGSCKMQFETLSEYLEHLNHECVNGGGGGSSCGGSVRSSSTPDDDPPSSGGDSELAYTVGVTENTPYGCQFCDKAFPRLSYLKRHEQIHSDQMPFRCDYCQRLFKHKRSRDRHVKLHTGDRKYRCTQCESAFSRSDHLKIHLRTHDNGKPYQCAVCNRGYNTAAALSSHMQNHKPTTAAATEQVMEMRNGVREDDPSKPLPSSPSLPHRSSFSSSSPLSVESPRPSSSRPPCFKCLDELSSPNAACTHKKSHADSSESEHKGNSDVKLDSRFSPMKQQLTCGFCSKSDFTSFESLQLHVQVMHVPQHDSAAALAAASYRSLQSVFQGNKRLPQHYDNFLGYTSSLMEEAGGALHLLQKHASLGDTLLKRPSDIYCSQCNIGFTTSSALLDHVHLVHERSPSSPLLTNHHSTGKRSRLRPNGVKHIKTSHSFNGSSHFRRHDPGGGGQSVGPSPDASTGTPATLLCSQCSAGFNDFESFRAHLKSHLDAAAAVAPAVAPVAPLLHPCGECGAELPSVPLLDAHVAGHFLSAATEYGCPSCVKLFAKPDELQKHLMDMHAHHLFRCALCKQIFDSKVSIQVHFAVKHSDEHRSLKCTSCHAYFRSEMEFQLHVKLNHLSATKSSTTSSYHSNTYRCLLCDQSFLNESQLRFHAATHRKEFACQECGEAFHVEFLLDKHMQAAHQVASSATTSFRAGTPQGSVVGPPPGSEEAQNLCTKKTNGPPASATDPTAPQSDTATPTPSSSPQPAKSPPSSLLRCDICDVTCATDAAMASHRRQTHRLQQQQKEHCSKSNGPTAVSLFCAYCNESCKSRGELENHMKAHTATPSKHKCNICDEICPSATTLAEHKLTHCKVVSGSTCIVCRVHLASEDQFISHIQQHATSASPNNNNNNNSSSSSNGLPVPCVICRQTLVVDIEVKMHARFHLKNLNNNELNNNCFGEQQNPLPSPCCVCGRMFDPGHLIIRASKDPLSHTYMCKECFHSKKGEGAAARCGDCGVKFETLVDLEVHRKSAHPKQKTYQCIKCQVTFESEAEVEAHVACHVLQEGTQHECRLCHEVLDSPSKLQCHLIEHSFEGSTHFTCYLCSAVFASCSLLQRHMFEHGLDSRPYDCNECGHKFFFRAELENHSFVHMWEKMARMAGHPKGNGESNRALVECSKCSCVFSSQLDLAKHQCCTLRDCKQEVLLPCPNCGMEFASAEDLRGHMILLHPNLPNTTLDRVSLPDFYKFEEDKLVERSRFKTAKDKKSFECPVCKKRFTRKENKKLHMKSHHPDTMKAFPCTHCDMVYTKRSQLKDHTRKEHALSDTSTCEVCDDHLPSGDHLRKHLRDAHGRTFEHTCAVCDAPFDDEHHLRQHQEERHQVQEEEPMIEPKTEVESRPASPEESSPAIHDPHEQKQSEPDQTDPDCTEPDQTDPDCTEPASTTDSELTVETDYAEAEGRRTPHVPTEVAA